MTVYQGKNNKKIDSVVGRWAHRSEGGKLPAPAKRLDYAPHGIVANPKRIRPQKYPYEQLGDFYFKEGKLYNIVYQGKIGTFEQWANVLGVKIATLRERMASGTMPMQEVMSKVPLNITRHDIDSSRAYRYCPCEYCVNKREQERLRSIKQVSGLHSKAKGRVFQSADKTIFVKNLQGELLTLKEWSDILGVSPGTLHARIMRYKWPLDRALNPSYWPDE